MPTPRPRAHPLGGGSVSGHDCSVANAVRRALGVAPIGMGHAPDDPAPAAADGGADASAPAADAAP
jgi:hypothetical protein